MKMYMAPIAAATMAIAGSAALAQQAPMTHPITMAAGMHDAADTATAVRMAMRELWEDHIIYTRGYIVSALADLPDTGAVAARLLKNQDDIGDAIKPYYGEKAGEKLSTLLRDHILIATEVVKAAKTGDKSGLKDAQQRWTNNGKDIAAFLSGANPNWSKKDLEEMLQKHLDLTTGEAVGRLNKDWTADIKAYDDGRAHMLEFADTLTFGIAKQFPGKFKNESVL